MKIRFCAALTAAMLVSTAAPVRAAPSKITDVKIEIQIEGEGEPELDVKSESNKYKVEYVDLEGISFSAATGPGAEISRKTVESGQENRNESSICEVELSAAEEYYFDTLQQKDIKINGIAGICTKAVRKDNGTTLVLTIQLTGLEQYVGKIEEVYFNNGYAEWEPATNAAVYGISLYKDSRKKGQYRETAGVTFDFTPLMTEPGQYFYKIHPISVSGKKGRTIESDVCLLNQEQAEFIQNANRGYKAGWQQDSERWQYRQPDLVPVQENWMAEGSDWYFFDEEGYMVTEEWRMWRNGWYYFGADGRFMQQKELPEVQHKERE